MLTYISITQPAYLLAEPSDPFIVPLASDSYDSPKLSLVLPTYQEAGNIEAVIDQVSEVLDSIAGLSYELIVVDDNSPDETWKIALRKASIHPHVRVIRRHGEKGLATAVFRGWQIASGEILGVMDADRQHPASALMPLLLAIDNGADAAVASRHAQGGGVSDWNWQRRLVSRCAQALAWVVNPRLAGQVTDPMSGFFLVRRQTLAGRPAHPLGYKVLLEVLAIARLSRVAEIPYVFCERTFGQSKINGKVCADFLRHLWRLRNLHASKLK